MNPDIVEISEAQYLSNYKIAVLFNDGKEQVIDLKEFLANAHNPVTRKYLDKNNF